MLTFSFCHKSSTQLVGVGAAKKSSAQAAGARGGPREARLLYSRADLAEDFAGLEMLELSEASAVLEEGALHVGASEVVRAVARKV